MPAELAEWFKKNTGRILKYTILLTVLFLGFQAVRHLFNENERLHTELIGQKEAYVQLSDTAAKLAIEYKSQVDLKAEVEKSWKNEKEALQGRIKILSNATFLIREKARVTKTSDVVFSGQNMNYVMNEIRFKDGPPIGYVLIFDDGRVTSKMYNHTIDLKTAVSQDETTGRYNIVSKADFILKSPHLSHNGKNWFNEPYTLKITSGNAFVDPTEKNLMDKHFILWAPVLSGGLNIGTDLKPALGMSLAGYGYSARDLDWKFLQIGMDYSKENGTGIYLTPVLYRPLPNYLRNTYIGVGVDIDKRIGYNPFMSLSVGF
jgi:hypothetical protein